MDKLPYEIVEQTFSNIVFEIPSYYKIVNLVGQGAYGVVVKAIDLRTKKKVAIKKCLNVFEHEVEYQKRILREIKLLEHFRNRENIINLIDLIIPKNLETFRDVYIVTDLMDGDLRSIIRSPQQLSDENIQYFLYQILKGVKIIHNGSVLHRDLKPSNILLNSKMDIKICDFGLARGFDFETDPTQSTTYVATRWYRSPELLLMWTDVTPAIDMWSIGCIFAELLDTSKPRRKVLFPGKHYLDQIDKIINICGTPKQEDIKGCHRGTSYVKNLPFKMRKDFKSLFPNASDKAIDLLEKMLEFNPLKRIKVDDALNHPYLRKLKEAEIREANGEEEKKPMDIENQEEDDEEDEEDEEDDDDDDDEDDEEYNVQPIKPFNFIFQRDVPKGLTSLKELIYNEILKFHNSKKFK